MLRIINTILSRIRIKLNDLCEFRFKVHMFLICHVIFMFYGSDKCIQLSQFFSNIIHKISNEQAKINGPKQGNAINVVRCKLRQYLNNDANGVSTRMIPIKWIANKFNANFFYDQNIQHARENDFGIHTQRGKLIERMTYCQIQRRYICKWMN